MDLIDIAKEDKFRRSVWAGINPRSETEVKEGSLGRRAARVVGGQVVGGIALGTVAGGAAALATKGKKGGRLTNQQLNRIYNTQRVGQATGAAVGTVVGSNENIRSGDTRATNRKTGKKAKSTAYIPFAGRVWRYGGKDLKPKGKKE